MEQTTIADIFTLSITLSINAENEAGVFSLTL